MLGVLRARAAAALCGGACRHARVLTVLGLDQGAKEAVRVHEANAKGNRTCAVLCSEVRHSGAVACVAARRRRVMPGHLGCATAKKITSAKGREGRDGAHRGSDSSRAALQGGRR
jgi:hypothetical protein